MIADRFDARLISAPGYEGGESFCRIDKECIIREGVTILRGTMAGSIPLRRAA
jgi:acyl-[acyl carrier protein]--UDP-N-acetylglucosamine O-acyltransferase